MAFTSIPVLWNKWNVRGILILSMYLQVFLILFAPLRKKTTNQLIIFLLWLAYLMADWVTAYGIGLVSHNQGNSCALAAEVDRALLAFWASFFLLHLGGPDTITAFSLKDNSLWKRHLLSLIFQVSAAIYVFVQIFPSDKSLVIPTMLVFFAGVIKNGERTYALNLSSDPTFVESMLFQYKFSDDAYNEMVEELDALGDGYSEEEEAKLAESIVVKHASYLFQILLSSIGDFVFGRQRYSKREYFCKVSALDALRMISIELQFIYEVLYTKALAIRSKWNYIFRFIAFTDIVVAFVLFHRLKKHRLPQLDAKITYFLLLGGIALDVIALCMHVFSDWTVAGIKRYSTGSLKLDIFLHKLLFVTDDIRKPRFATCEAKPNANVTYAILDTPLIFRRWSESICACNLFSESLKESPRKMYKRDWHWSILDFRNVCSSPFRMARKIISCFHHASETIAGGCGLRNTKWMIANTKYVSKNPFIKKLWIFIFEEARRKFRNVNDRRELKEIIEARGDLFLKSRPGDIDCDTFLAYVTEANYGLSVLTWHVAAEIWYNIEKPTAKNEEREVSKTLSDYMLYLLLNQSNMVSNVAGNAHVIAAEMVHKLQKCTCDATKDVEGLCKKLFEDSYENFQMRSPLREGIRLAQEMVRLEEMKWKAMSGVWVEMLSYAAFRVGGDALGEVLSNGGELLAFVWLLMGHFKRAFVPEEHL